MRIYFDHQITSLQDFGGISRYYYELLRHFSGMPELQVEMALGVCNPVLPFAETQSRTTRVWGWRGGSGSRSARYALNEVVCGTAALASRKADIYHPTLYRCMPSVRARRIVVTHHDCIYERFPTISSRTSKILEAKRKQFERADAIISVSESSKADLLRYYAVESGKIKVIHHGITPLNRDPSAERQLREWMNRPYILYVGSRASYKNFLLLLEAFGESKLHSDYDLLVIGGGRLSDVEVELSATMGISNRIKVVPRATESLLAEAYASARLFVYPSLYEGFGFPPLEAMTLGCPVLVGRTSSLPEVCGDAAFYFDTSDPLALARALMQAVTNEPDRSTAIRRGYKRSADFTWTRCGEETFALYSSLL